MAPLYIISLHAPAFGPGSLFKGLSTPIAEARRSLFQGGETRLKPKDTRGCGRWTISAARILNEGLRIESLPPGGRMHAWTYGTVQT